MAGNTTDHSDDHNSSHVIDDFGVGTLVLAFTIGLVTRTFLQKYIKFVC